MAQTWSNHYWAHSAAILSNFDFTFLKKVAVSQQSESIMFIHTKNLAGKYYLIIPYQYWVDLIWLLFCSYQLWSWLPFFEKHFWVIFLVFVVHRFAGKYQLKKCKQKFLDRMECDLITSNNWLGTRAESAEN